MDALREYVIDSVEILRHRRVSSCFIFFVQRKLLPQTAPNIAFKHRVFDEVYKSNSESFRLARRYSFSCRSGEMRSSSRRDTAMMRFPGQQKFAQAESRTLSEKFPHGRKASSETELNKEMRYKY